MVDRYMSPKFGVKSFSGIRGNDVYGRRTDDDGRQIMDARVTTVDLLCRAKNREY